MWIWQGRRKPDEDLGVVAGRRFRSLGVPPVLWEVDRIARFPGEVVAHVCLHRVGMPNDGKTISLQALLDRRLYLPVQ